MRGFPRRKFPAHVYEEFVGLFMKTHKFVLLLTLGVFVIFPRSSTFASNSDWTDGQPADSVIGQEDFDS